jgi:glycosyltransferase involved in cell wall biosynthesis
VVSGLAARADRGHHPRHDPLVGARCNAVHATRRARRVAYERAGAIITVSSSSKNNIVDRWPALASKTTVIGHGVNETFLRPTFDAPPASAFDNRVPSRYLLYIGGGIPRKRLDWALAVWSALRIPGLGFVACGLGQSERVRWLPSIPKDWQDLFFCPDFVTEETLASLYAGAELVLYPTLDEGFGLPALESQAVGTRILLSAVGGLRELLGPGAVALPADDLPAWIGACNALIGDRSVRDASRAWAASFTWRDAWQRTLSVYQFLARTA